LKKLNILGCAAMGTIRPSMTARSGYVLEFLREGGDFTLYRGRQNGNPSPVLAVALAAEQPSPQALRRLEHEYSLAADLDPAWAAKPLALTRHEGRTILVLKDPGGDPLDRILEQHQGQPLELTLFLRIAIGLATALGQVHRHSRRLAEWETGGHIDLFPLGTHDVSDRLLIPEKLYGRESEVNALLAAFDRVVTHGTRELVLVSGYSGVGKSSVVNELHKVLVPPRGLFAAGKFDRTRRRSERRARTASPRTKSWPMRWPRGSTPRGVLRQSPMPICAKHESATNAGARSAR
jgi:hypothetical protein